MAQGDVAETARGVASVMVDPEFFKLWLGQSVSVLGSQVTLVALPLAAVVALHASAADMGVLQALEAMPFLLFALAAGVWLDRVRRRPVMVAADIGRALVLGAVPAAAALGRLSMPVLYAVAFLAGSLTVLFDVASQAYVPSLVGRGRLAEANGRMQLSQSVASLLGPALGGLLVGLVTAPAAIGADAVSYVASVAAVASIRRPEAQAPARDKAAHRSGRALGDIGEGMRLVFGHRILRPLTFTGALTNLCMDAMLAILILYAHRNLGLGSVAIGILMSLGAVGGIAGALLTERAARRLGPGPVLVASVVITSVGMVLIPLAGGSRPELLAMLLAAAVLVFGGSVPFNIVTVTLRQRLTPDHLLGRMTATVRFVIWGVRPIGALAGGLLGAAVGLRPTLAAAAATFFLAVPLLWVSAVHSLGTDADTQAA